MPQNPCESKLEYTYLGQKETGQGTTEQAAKANALSRMMSLSEAAKLALGDSLSNTCEGDCKPVPTVGTAVYKKIAVETGERLTAVTVQIQIPMTVSCKKPNVVDLAPTSVGERFALVSEKELTSFVEEAAVEPVVEPAIRSFDLKSLDGLVRATVALEETS